MGPDGCTAGLLTRGGGAHRMDCQFELQSWMRPTVQRESGGGGKHVRPLFSHARSRAVSLPMRRVESKRVTGTTTTSSGKTASPLEQ
jgi:hypothetical protein